MTKDGGQRIATASGAMLADPHRLGNAHPDPVDANENLFEPAFWAARGELVDVTRGRGSAWFITREPQPWVLRHYRRGGLIARLSQDRYVWAGEDRVRAFAEWRLLAWLTERGLPVPKPIAARYQRSGLFYRCDLITQRIVGADPLSSVMAHARVPPGVWRAMGATIARLHAAGADHADLNAHNILLGDTGSISVIDFDRGRVRQPGSWSARNLSRLQRSLLKVGRALPADRFTMADWAFVLQGYASP
jgi:3-deoxy-D-manno-octulosonic acid kinase